MHILFLFEKKDEQQITPKVPEELTISHKFSDNTHGATLQHHPVKLHQVFMTKLTVTKSQTLLKAA